MTWLFTHSLRTSPGSLLPFCLYRCLCHTQLDVVPGTCPCLFLVLSGLLFLIIFYLPFKIILASPALKKPCLTSSFPNTFTELHSPCVPPCNPLFALITSYHNYCFMCSSSHKTGEPLRTRILPVSVFPVAWNKKKQKQAMFIE